MARRNAAEQAVLGALMIEPSLANSVELTPEDFTHRDHREIFRAIRACVDGHQPADAVTVAEWLDQHSEVSRNDWLMQCATMVKDTPTTANFRAYADNVRQKSEAAKAKRIAIDLCEAVDKDPDIIDTAVRELMKLRSTNRSYESSVSDQIGPVIDYIDDRCHNKDKIPGLRTGLDRFDRKQGGLGNGHLIVIGARPGMGKTALMGGLHLANRNIASGIISAEQPARELTMRMVASMAGVSAHDLRMGTIRDEAWPHINNAMSILKSTPIYINDRSAPSIHEIERQARKWKYEHDIKLLSVDYLQRIRSTGSAKRHEQVEGFARTLKELARELDIPVVALSAVSREVEHREDKRPVMADLRDSGAIEAEADLILTLYRDEVYNDERDNAGKAEISAIKFRHGPLGRVTVHYDGATLTFSDFGIDGSQPRRIQGRNGATERSMELGLGEDDRAENRRATRA